MVNYVMEHIDRAFKLLLKNHYIDDLNTHTGVIYGVWANYRLAYLNPAWFRFALENGGEPQITADWGLGRSILDCMSGVVREFYKAKFDKCLMSHEVCNHLYECSSKTVYRRYHQIVYPLGDREGLLFVNSLITNRPHDKEKRPDRDANELFYVDENGFICQCALCRRTKNLREAERWDWVPEWVRQCPEHTSHTFCPSCFGHYFPLTTTTSKGRT
ncbi:hypothetical protein SAMN05216302_104423 [Nitrosomonas aestuarii]|uniref:Uncharacterized protein n=1 Tax=Nitrosomonas aestuarii TaxID=52441 RepID=A0A1I4G0W0_9PROT|nr:hypothetical protein SAMN05216302_104423 [Nitrosomonas aestuarii]